VTFKNAGMQQASHGRCRQSIFSWRQTAVPCTCPSPRTRNEPSRLPLIAAKIAELQHLSIGDIARATSYGAYRMFGIGSPGAPLFVYALKNSLYINLTIRCNADCVFCDRKGEAVIKDTTSGSNGSPPRTR